MLGDLLEHAERLRAAGDRALAVSTLRTVVARAKPEGSPSNQAESRALRAVATYQLALLTLQAREVAEGDALCWRLGYRLRLADDVLAYATVLAPAAGSPPPPPEVPTTTKAWYVDGALDAVGFAAFHRVFGADAPYWQFHGYPTPTFFSHNVDLSDDEGGPLVALLRRLRGLAAAKFPAVAGATSVEVWAHAREADGHHQLHYDLDEVALRRREFRAPLASSVFYLDTVSGAEGGAPTLVVDRELQLDALLLQPPDDDGGDGDGAKWDPDGDAGWLCTPRPNRFLTFDGRLLHCVVPTIARKASPSRVNRKRVTVMLGWWRSVNLGTGDRAPNMPLPRDAPWLEPLGRDATKATRGQGETGDSDTRPVPSIMIPADPVARVWSRVPAPLSDDDGEAASSSSHSSSSSSSFGDLASDDVEFTGRFFLRAGSTREIDAAVLAPRDGATPPQEPGPGPPRDEVVEFVSIDDILKQQQAAARNDGDDGKKKPASKKKARAATKREQPEPPPSRRPSRRRRK